MGSKFSLNRSRCRRRKNNVDRGASSKVYQLRIEIQMLACTAWWKTLGHFNVCEARTDSRRHWNSLMFYTSQLKLKFWISILIFIFYIINSLSALTLHSIGFLIFGIKFHFTEVLELPGGGFPALYVKEIYVNKKRYKRTLTKPCLNARPRSRDSSMFCIEKWTQRVWLLNLGRLQLKCKYCVLKTELASHLAGWFT